MERCLLTWTKLSVLFVNLSKTARQYKEEPSTKQIRQIQASTTSINKNSELSEIKALLQGLVPPVQNATKSEKRQNTTKNLQGVGNCLDALRGAILGLPQPSIATVVEDLDT